MQYYTVTHCHPPKKKTSFPWLRPLKLAQRSQVKWLEQWDSSLSWFIEISSILTYHHWGTMELTPTKNPTHMDEQCWKPPVFLCLFWRCKNVMLSEGCLVVPLSFQQQKPLWVTRGCLRKDAARPRIFQNSPSLQNGLEGNVIPEICFWKVTPIFSPPIKIHTEPKRPRGESPIKLPDLRKKIMGAPMDRSVSSSYLATNFRL